VVELLLLNAAVIAGWMVLVWLISIPMRNVAIIDIAWGLGFIIVAWFSDWWIAPPGSSALLLLTLVTFWGGRLSGYLFWRNVGKPEDKRYQAMRDKRGEAFTYSSLWIVFLPQGVLTWIVSLPVQLGIHESQGGWHWLHGIGILLWLVGFLFESIGDYQLAKFLADPNSKGQVMNRGLWRYTRHPNYFGDFLVWWGIFLVAIADQWHISWTIIGPLVMSYLLIQFSGVPMLEATMKTSRPGYAEYVRRTSGFFPWWPKKA
jgi:steroid 5-alpha reductase family enzyme